MFPFYLKKSYWETIQYIRITMIQYIRIIITSCIRWRFKEGPWWIQDLNHDPGFCLIILRNGRLREKWEILFSCHRVSSIPSSTLFTTCKRLKIFIDLPKNICTLLDTSPHIHVWMASFCSNDHRSIQSKLKWELRAVRGVMSVATEDKMAIW